MSKFYTAVAQYGNSIMCKEIVDGKSRIRKIPYQPSFYVRTNDKSSPFKTMEGEPLRQNKFANISDARDYVNRYKDVKNHEFFGNANIIYQFICDEFPNTIDFDLSQLQTWILDIETETELGGFPHPAEAAERLQLVTMLNNQTKKYVSWGLLKFSEEDALQYKDEFDITKIDLEYRYFTDETELLKDMLFWWKNNQIDCLTDWNGEGFDIPYMVNRIRRVLGEDAVAQLSPFRMVKDKTVVQGDKEFTTYELLGIAHLDYLQLYKKFTYTTRETYKLDHIGDVELGVKKLDMGCPFRESYKGNNITKFVLYNLRDCEIVDKLEDKLGLIQLAYTIAYDAKCLPNDVFGAVKTWDCMMYRFMFEQNIIVPQKIHRNSWSIEGAYVKEPVPGQYQWIASVDAASLYPTIIMQYNMSPETLIDEPMLQVTVDGLLEKKYSLDHLADQQIGMTANGQYFRNDVKGLFPEIVSRQFSDRKMYKKLMQKSEAELESVKELMKATGKTDDLVARYTQLTKEVSKFNNFQMAKKILMNSLYGAMGNQGFRFFDPRIAEGITKTGQYFIRAVGETVTAFISRMSGKQGDWAFYGDTDSSYFTLAPILEKFVIPKALNEDGSINTSKVVDSMDKIVNEKITPVINAACDDIAKYTNSLDQLMNFKREALADRGVWIAKKRYAINVIDNEGIRYSEPKIKIMGLEIVRSSTPAPVRQMLKDAVKIVLTGNEKELQRYCEVQEAAFMKLQPEDIAYPRGVQRLEHYSNPSTIYQKGCPIHVRAALMFNHLIQSHGLENEYPLIQDGDKIKFIMLKTPNTVRENCIGFIDRFPRELNIQRYVDYDEMWQKAFLNPLDNIIKTINWNYREVASLDSLFE